MNTTEAPSSDTTSQWLKYSVAWVWLTSGLFVLHPYYRTLGAQYLEVLGLPSWPMYAACTAEVVLALWIIRSRASTSIVGLQLVAICGFTLVLGSSQPMLLAHPFGALTKNIPLVTALIASWLLEREGWSARAVNVLRLGVAAIWITEGIFPKIFFQQEVELVIARSISSSAPEHLVMVLGVAQALSGMAVLMLSGRSLRWMLTAQFAALLALPLLVTLNYPLEWFHPFGPLTKNLPILAATYTLIRICSTHSSRLSTSSGPWPSSEQE